MHLTKQFLHTSDARLAGLGIHRAMLLVTDLLGQTINFSLELEDGVSSRVHLDEAALRC
jgi:hypothetical protein